MTKDVPDCTAVGWVPRNLCPNGNATWSTKFAIDAIFIEVPHGRHLCNLTTWLDFMIEVDLEEMSDLKNC